MVDSVLIGRGETITSIPQSDREHELSSAPESISRRLEFMTEDHHLVRNFVVRELPRLGRSIALAEISGALQLTRERTKSIDGYRRQCVFFWSAEHAHDYGPKVHQMNEACLSLAQGCSMTRNVQGALFAV